MPVDVRLVALPRLGHLLLAAGLRDKFVAEAAPRPDARHRCRVNYAVSRVNIVPPSQAIARESSKLLAATGLHG
ncbi:hypothetical protein [Streptomyces carpinensis]|uniref:Uncharacterized protein n=1 Tax=Streptomyces carpinensis TaxID=66369 RepID=A0ABV1W346_9ACTN